jgi:hypothetical protein
MEQEDSLPGLTGDVRTLVSGVGWMDGTRPTRPREGLFSARSDGVTFAPRRGRPERGEHRFYAWSCFTEARVEVAASIKGLHDGHRRILGDDQSHELVVSRVALPWGGEDVAVIIPVDTFTVDDWLGRFDAAGVLITGSRGRRPSALADVGSGTSASDPARPHRTSAQAPRWSGQWRSDPTGRHQYRYYGTAWTKHVSDQGKLSTDAL